MDPLDRTLINSYLPQKTTKNLYSKQNKRENRQSSRKFKAFVLSMCELLYKDFIEMTHFSFELQKETVEGEQVVSETFSEAT